MKLVDILARDMNEWPRSGAGVAQIGVMRQNDFGGVYRVWNHSSHFVGHFELAEDWGDGKVKFEQWQAARDALKCEPECVSDLKAQVKFLAELLVANGIGEVVENKDGSKFYAVLTKGDDQPAWDGPGLPPVGMVCELRRKDGGWGLAIIKYMSSTICVWLWNNGNPDQREWSCEPYNMEFRPIRTPEQIAAEERKRIEDEIQSICTEGENKGVPYFKALYEAGYRKQVTE